MKYHSIWSVATWLYTECLFIIVWLLILLCHLTEDSSVNCSRLSTKLSTLGNTHQKKYTNYYRRSRSIKRRAAPHEEIDISLNGDQFLSHSLLSSSEGKVDEENNLFFLFKTTLPSCLLFYASGTSGHYIMAEIIRGKLRFSINMDGNVSPKPYRGELIMGEYSDNTWHQLEISRRRNKTIITIDIATEIIYIPFKTTRINLNDHLNIGGLSKSMWRRVENHVDSKQNFSGCLSDFQWGKHSALFNELKKDPLSIKPRSSKALWECPDGAPYQPISFHNQQGFVRVTKSNGASQWNMSFSFRTYEWNSTLAIGMREDVLIFSLAVYKSKLQLWTGSAESVTIGDNFDDGLWHSVLIIVKPRSLQLIVNDQVLYTAYNMPLNLTIDHILFGKAKQRQLGFIGCMRDLSGLGQNVTLETMDGGNIMYGSCAMVDHCYPNPCQNNGRCMQNGNKITCQCGEKHSGDLCQNIIQLFSNSCLAYYDKGKRISGIYTIKINEDDPISVYCNMSSLFGPITIMNHDHMTNTDVGITHDSLGDYYRHPIRYNEPISNIRSVIKRSKFCRQYIKYSCYRSTIFNSNGIQSEQNREFGVRWYSGSGVLEEYWGGANRGSLQCFCAKTKSCVIPSLACNCDAMDDVFRSDEGYITQKDLLPITMMQISKYKTNVASSFDIGPLECYEKDPTILTTPLTTPHAILSTTSSPKVTNLTAKTHSTISPVTIDTTESTINATLNTTIIAYPTTISTTNQERSPKNVILMEENNDSSDKLGDSQMAILISVILILVVIVILIIFALLRQRSTFCKRRNDPLKGSLGTKDSPVWSRYSSSDERQQSTEPYDMYQMMERQNHIPRGSNSALSRLSGYPKAIANGWGSGSSVSTIDASRYLEAEGESDTTCGVLAPKRGILKSRHGENKYKTSSCSSCSDASKTSMTSLKKELFNSSDSSNGDCSKKLVEVPLLYNGEGYQGDCGHGNEINHRLLPCDSVDRRQKVLALISARNKYGSNYSCKSLSCSKDSDSIGSVESFARSLSSSCSFSSEKKKRSVRFSLGDSEEGYERQEIRS